MFSAHIDDTQDSVCLQIRSQTRDFSKKHAACQPFRGGAIENLDVLTGPSHPALVWMKHVDISYGNELQQQLEQLMGDFYREPQEENLVHIDFLAEEALNYNLKLVDTKLFIDKQDNLFNDYKKEKSDYHKKIEENDAVKQWTSFQRWFIFQKID